jgi:hypothetical protein
MSTIHCVVAKVYNFIANILTGPDTFMAIRLVMQRMLQSIFPDIQ